MKEKHMEVEIKVQEFLKKFYCALFLSGTAFLFISAFFQRWIQTVTIMGGLAMCFGSAVGLMIRIRW
jgi:hypothetical protein